MEVSEGRSEGVKKMNEDGRKRKRRMGRKEGMQEGKEGTES